MDNKKIVYNNEQYNILTNINIGTTTFLICIDIFDKKLQYFKQEMANGKIKLTSSANLVQVALDVNKKSIANKKKILDSFNLKIQESLAKSVFVDRNKVIELFKLLPNEIDSCDLKYYIIDNASIEVSDSSITNLINKFNNKDITKDLNNVSESKNELYYYNIEEPVKPKEKMVENNTTISAPVSAKDPFANDPLMASNPIMAKDPFKDNPLMTKDPFLNNDAKSAPVSAKNPFLNNDVKSAPIINPSISADLEKIESELSQTQVIANILSSAAIKNEPNDCIDVPSSNSIEALVNKDYVAPVKQNKADVIEPVEKDNFQKKVNNLKESPKFYIIIISVSLIIAILGFLILFNKKDKNYSNKEIMKQVLDVTTITNIKEGTNYNEPIIMDNNYGSLIKENLINVDFNELIETNSDTIGWISIKGLDINYPIVQAKTNEYYTNHSYYKKASKSGWIHSDISASLNKLGNNTIIYGANPSDKTLFANLIKALDKKIETDINMQAIKISTLKENTLWQVFSVYEIPIEEYYLTTKFSNIEEYINFLNEMKARSKYDFGVNLNENDKILTLTTNKDDNTRIVVQAKLIKINEKGD